jgi:hypothetical protein
LFNSDNFFTVFEQDSSIRTATMRQMAQSFSGFVKGLMTRRGVRLMVLRVD